MPPPGTSRGLPTLPLTHSVHLGPLYTVFRITRPWDLCKHRHTFPKPPLSRSACSRKSEELILMSSKDMAAFLLKGQNAPETQSCEEKSQYSQYRQVVTQTVYIMLRHVLRVPLFFEDRFIVSEMNVYHISRNHRRPQSFFLRLSFLPTWKIKKI